MEMILLLLCLTTLLSLLFIQKLLNRTTSTNLNLPPSPWRLPVIGNLHQLSHVPHRSLRSLSLRYGPLMLLHLGRAPVLVVSSADIAQEVLRTHDLKFANRPKLKMIDRILKGGRNLGFSSYGEYWRQLKSKCILNLLSSKMVRSFEKVREEEIIIIMGKLKKASSSSSSVNLSDLLMTLANDIICRVSLGRKYNVEESGIDVKSTMKEIMELMGTFPLGEYIPSLACIDRIRGVGDKMDEVNNKFDGFLERVVQEHIDADKGRSDFVDILLSIQRNNSLPDFDRKNLKLVLWDMFVAGTTTTSTTLEWIMTMLIKYPECMRKLQEEVRSVSPHNLYVTEGEVEKMKYLKGVIKEGLRLYPAAPLLCPRVLSEDVKLKGYEIVAGTQVIINAWAFQRDIDTWGMDAEVFNPERHFDSPLDFKGQHFMYIPFGSGRRMCLGVGFAVALVEVTLANLVKCYNWRVQSQSSGDEYDLAEAAGFELRRKFPLIAFPSSA